MNDEKSPEVFDGMSPGEGPPRIVPAPGNGKMVTVKKAAEKLKISDRTIHGWMRKGAVIYAKAPGSWSKVDLGSVLEFAKRSNYGGNNTTDREFGINATRKILGLPPLALKNGKERVQREEEVDQPRLQFPPEPCDIHKKAASQVFERGLRSVTPEQRGAGKTMNFGELYGAHERIQNLLRSARTCLEEMEGIVGRFFREAPETPPPAVPEKVIPDVPDECHYCGFGKITTAKISGDPCNENAEFILVHTCLSCHKTWAS